MSKKLSKDRPSLCTFTFADGRRCSSPRQSKNADFCFFHAQRERQRSAAQEAGRFIAEGICTDYVSACALSGSLGRLFRAVARGDVNPKTAHTLGYLAQIMAQTLPMADQEFSRTFGYGRWHTTITNAFRKLNPSFLKRVQPAPSSEEEQEEELEPEPSTPVSPTPDPAKPRKQQPS